MSACVVRWENLAITFKTWNWELGFRYSRNEGQDLSVGEVSQPGLRDALLDTNPATAFDPFLNFTAHNTKAARQRVYVTLHNSGEYELPIGYATVNGDLFNLPAGPVSFALGGEYDAPRWTRDRDALNTTFQSIGSTDGGSARVNRDVWSIYQEVRVPFTSPTWNFPVSTASRLTSPSARNGTARTPLQFYLLEPSHFSRRPTASITRRSQKFPFAGNRLIPNISARSPCVAATPKRFMLRLYRRFRPLPRRASTIVLRSIFEAERAMREERVIGNPNLQPEVAYEWSYGARLQPEMAQGPDAQRGLVAY